MRHIISFVMIALAAMTSACTYSKSGYLHEATSVAAEDSAVNEPSPVDSDTPDSEVIPITEEIVDNKDTTETEILEEVPNQVPGTDDEEIAQDEDSLAAETPGTGPDNGKRNKDGTYATTDMGTRPVDSVTASEAQAKTKADPKAPVVEAPILDCVTLGLPTCP